MASLQDHIETIQHYFKHGYEPGSCTRAILENDLLGACQNADPTTQRILFDIVKYCYNHLPMDVWGSPEKVRQHLQKVRAKEMEPNA